uniref:Uncharacterized protein n=1 Tax=viral metagenome TaxID=1070528 RepID=A0A6M3LIW8_9ZZZZ
MSIRISVQKFEWLGIQYYKILNIKALEKEKLPLEYINADEDESVIWLDNKGEFFGGRSGLYSPHRLDGDLIIGELYREDVFERKLEHIEKAGKFLNEIKNNIHKKEWTGRKTFVI